MDDAPLTALRKSRLDDRPLLLYFPPVPRQS
jgi:hypothetical protein